MSLRRIICFSDRLSLPPSVHRRMNDTFEEAMTTTVIPSEVRFWIFLLLLIPSTFGCLWMLYYLFTHQTLRQAPRNHIAILLLLLSLIPQLTVIPGMLHFYHLNGQWDRPRLLCQFWGYIDWTCYGLQVVLVGYGSIERHLLLFRERWFSTRIKLISCHYLPIGLLILYEVVFYLFVFFFPPCDELISVLQPICVDSCFMYYPQIAAYDSIANQILPPFLLVFFNVLLIVRIVRQKSRLHHRIHWRKHRKMAVQFFILSSIYVVCITPYAIDIMLYYIGAVYQGQETVSDYLTLLTYLPQLSMPFTFGLSLPELRRKLFRILRPKRTARVLPAAAEKKH